MVGLVINDNFKWQWWDCPFRASPTALYLGMWRAKMQKWCFNSSLFHSSYCQIATVTFHKWKATVALHWIKNWLSLSSLFSFSFLPFSPALSPLSSVEALISAWGGARSRPGWSTDLSLVWSVDLGLRWSSISAWVERRSRPMVERRWSRPMMERRSHQPRTKRWGKRWRWVCEDGFVELLDFLELLVGSPPADWGWFWLILEWIVRFWLCCL